jgi:hypothetical protein
MAEQVSIRPAHELTARLGEELARFGAVGAIRLEGSEVLLLHPSGPRRVNVEDWLPHWHELDEPTRRIRVSQLARSLARPTSLPASRPKQGAAARIRAWLGGGALLTVMALGALWLMRELGRAGAAVPPRAFGRPSADAALADSPAGPSAAGPSAAVARASLVCASTRARVVRGATVSIADSEGWVVEYMAFRATEGTPLHLAPVLSTFFEAPAAPEGSRYIWPAEPELAATPTSEDRVLVRPETIAGPLHPTYPGLRVTFAGALVDAYFRPATRVAYFHLASALSDALGATHAALYARCADGNTHHLGSWFRGRGHEDAVASLVYTLGTFAEPPHLAEPYLHPVGAQELDRAHAFANITRVSSALDRPLLAGLLGREGGMVMGRPGEAVTLTFPFEDGNRASRLSREIARLTNIGGL